MELSMRRLAILLFGLLALPSVALAACSCDKADTLKEAVQNSNIAFTGRVSSVRASPLRKGYIEVDFSVFSQYKNEFSDMPHEKVLIYTSSEKDSCGFPFLLEQDYLVFATGTPAFYQVSKCSRTAVVDVATKDIQKLNSLIKK